MKRGLLFSLVGIGAFLFFLIAKTPASLIPTLAPEHEQLSLQATSGTIWNGRIGQIQAGPMRLGPAEWNLRASRLLLGRLDADINLEIERGNVDARIVMRPGGRIEIPEATGLSIPLAPFAPVFNQAADSIHGEAGFQARDLVLLGDTLQQGEVDLRVFDLVLNLMGRHELGNFTGHANGQSAEFEVNFSDVGDDGPFRVQGNIDYRAEERRYELEARIGAREHAPANLAGALQYLGEQDEDGLYPVRFGGRVF
ncbi:type II secretion system protein N [Natronospira sp.]|uniref:type II secretion system protein N n=1 Tax=Natronospira sp. TaxID=2024970 RepID=UPI0038733675